MSAQPTPLEKNYHAVITRLEQSCKAHQRPVDSVELLAVSKTKPAAMIESLYASGHRAFGENYLQEALEKIQQLTHLPDLIWHFIGPLQANKSRAVAENFHWLETLDRLRIAQRLHEQRPDHLAPLNVLIQVNISGETQKSGILIDDVMNFALALQPFTRLKLRGLMCIAEQTDDISALRQQFEHMHQRYAQLQTQFPNIDRLSMGMSGDMDLAIACGSTEIRIGTDIFGARELSHAH